tara:strand:+ start:342 stop:620 length:279 start_codon:yes stop_codon:yes gene_type:complete
MNDFITKIYLRLIAVCFITLSIQLTPISKLASTWNKCIKKTSGTLNQVKGVRKINAESKDVLSVMIKKELFLNQISNNGLANISSRVHFQIS